MAPAQGGGETSDEDAGPIDSASPEQARPAGASPRVVVEDNPFSDLDALEPYLEGIASWYGPGFHGEATANGEIYNQYGLTAAHPMLPLGTKVEVENLANGRKVWLRINDRGPYKKGRILDLSRLAAERLGIVNEGTAPVAIRVLRWPDRIDPSLGLRAYTQFVVQVAARPESAEAEAHRQAFQERFSWLSFRIDRPPGSQYTVIAGPYDDEPAARAAALRLQREGVTCLVRSYRK
jgi:rare lipoprotein A